MADLNIGNSTANVIVNAKHNGAVNPQINNTYDLGTSALRWKNIYGSLKGNADSATTAINLAAAGTWTWTGGTTAGPTASLVLGGKTTSVGAIPSASASASGIITTGTQTIAGEKTFTSNLSIKKNTPNLYITDTNTGVGTFSVIHFGSTNASGTTNETAASIFLNGPQRTNDGGANLMTIRNNVGDLRLNNDVINTGKLTVGQATKNASYKLYVNGTSYFANNMFIPENKSLIQYQNDSSNYTTLIEWYKGSKSQNTYDPQIGQHNTGGTGSAGSITILPYATATNPWDGSVGLYITKNKLVLDNCRIPTTGNTSGNIGSSIKPVYISEGIITASNATVGSSTKGMYLNSGTMTAMAYNLGANIYSYSGSLATGGWKTVHGKSDSPMISIAYNSSAAAWNSGKYSASMVFGCEDTRGLLDLAYNSPIVTFGGASYYNVTDDNPNWYFKLNGTSGQMYTFPTSSKTLCATDGTGASGTWGISISGNAATASYTTRLLGVDNSNTPYDAIEGNLIRAVWNVEGDSRWYLKAGTYNCRVNYADYAVDADTVDGYHFSDLENRYVKKSGDTMTGNLRITNTNPYIHLIDTNASYATHFYVQEYQGLLYLGAGVANSIYINSNGKLYGAVWNDYAEYRSSNITEPGRVVIENGDGTLSLSTKRLQRGAEIISDTFGFAIGETDECKTPIAVSGRVLAYYSGDIKEFKPGYPVCSGPNGTVSVMTEEEEEKYPSRIIGTVSEIPTYEKWGTGNVEVNGRIWIRIR